MIRPYTSSDLAELKNLYATAALDYDLLQNQDYRSSVQLRGFVLDVESERKIETLIDRAQQVFVYEEDGIEGCSVVSDPDKQKEVPIVWVEEEYRTRAFDSKTTGFIHHTIVKPDRHREKIGSRLLHASETYLKERGRTHSCIMIPLYPLANTVSIPFHAKQGYHVIGISERYSQFGFDDFMMALYGKSL